MLGWYMDNLFSEHLGFSRKAPQQNLPLGDNPRGHSSFRISHGRRTHLLHTACCAVSVLSRACGKEASGYCRAIISIAANLNTPPLTETPTGLGESTAIHLQFVRQYAPGQLQGSKTLSPEIPQKNSKITPRAPIPNSLKNSKNTKILGLGSLYLVGRFATPDLSFRVIFVGPWVKSRGSWVKPLGLCRVLVSSGEWQRGWINEPIFTPKLWIQHGSGKRLSYFELGAGNTDRQLQNNGCSRSRTGLISQSSWWWFAD